MKKFLGFSVVAVAFALSVSFASAANYNITPSLTMGSTGPEVVELQQMLVAKGNLVMPAGVSMGYFGTLTKNALAAFQAANGISPAVGYYGPVTAAKVNSMAMGGTTGGNTGGNTGGLSGGDGDFKDFDVLGSPSNTDVDEGETEEVFGFEFEADDSDLQIERIDVLASSTNSNEDRPWKVIEEMSIVIDGDEVATVDASDEDNWDETSTDDTYSIRFDDVDYVVDEGDTVKVYVSVTASDDLDTDETGTWDISLEDDGVRALNAEGIDVYEGVDTDEKEFDLQEAEAGDLNISVDEDENEDEEVEVDEDDETEEVVLYTAQVESEQGTNNIEEVTVTIATTTGTTNGLSDFVNTLYLFIDGEEVGSESVNDDAASEAIVFDDIDFDIDEDEEVDFVVKADINEQDGNFATTSTGVSVTLLSIDFVDAQDDDQTVSDSTGGGDITFSVDALMVELSDTPSAESPVANDESKGRFTVEFEVTAPANEDIFISKGATTSTTIASGLGAEFIVVDGSGTSVTATTTVSSNLLTKVTGGSETGGRYKISKGNTATFRLDVIVDNTGASSARTLGVQLTGVNLKAGSNAVADVQFTAGLDEDFRSDTAYLLTSNTSN